MEKKDICIEVKGLFNNIVETDEKIPQMFSDDFSESLDSIELVMLIVEIENAFDIKVEDADFEIEKINTIDKIADLIMTYKKQA